MLILTVRTDKPEAEIGLYDGEKKLVYETWGAHRQLAETIHIKVAQQLKEIRKDWSDIEGIVCFRGPGSFTGLRIGLSVVNALAAGNNIPVVGSTGGKWIESGISILLSGKNDSVVVPEYGADAHITAPRK